ncbi:MAG: HDOD domain-containing protein [Desulfomonilia bacterium]
MNVTCPNCKQVYELKDENLQTINDLVRMPCPNCKTIIAIDLTQSDKDVPPAPTGKDLKDRIFNSLHDLPPMPQVAQKARTVISDPDSSFADLARVIETDQGIATRILKMANSAYYGMSGNISSVQHAAVVLGTKTLMELLTLACSSKILGKTLSGYDLAAGDLWQHSLAVAYGSQLIARTVHSHLEQDAFAAGLIHDAGKLILDPYLGERKEEFQAFVREGKETFLEAEKRILGFDHAELASEVCAKWHIPDHIALAIRYHHDPTPAHGDVLAHIVHASDSIAIMSGIGSGIDGMLYRMHPETVALLGLTEDTVSGIMAGMAHYIDKTSQEL